MRGMWGVKGSILSAPAMCAMPGAFDCMCNLCQVSMVITVLYLRKADDK